MQLVRDVNADGSHQPALERGVAGIEVTAFDASGKSAKATTGADGVATVDPAAAGLGGGRYRVEASIPASMGYLKPAASGGPAPSLSPLVTFVDASAGPAKITMGVHNPADYAQANPPLATPIQFGMEATRQDPAKRALVRWPYDRRGLQPPADVVATHQQIGSTYGLAWRRSTGTLYAGALAKRFVTYGPQGPGGIYQIAADGTVSTFATVPDAGTTQHGEWTRDAGFWGVAGTEGLGDVDISEDDKTLYTVNLASKSLVSYDLDTAKVTGTHRIPSPCRDERDWRPYGLGIQDGKVHVGGVCSGAVGGTGSLSAHISVFGAGDGSFAEIHRHALTFPRGHQYNQSAGSWKPWLDTWSPAKYRQTGGRARLLDYAQPILSDIEFDRDGSLMVGFRDRFGDQNGENALSPNPADGTRYGFWGGSGDIVRICKSGDTLVWEGDRGCPNNAAGKAVGSQPANVAEYYYGDHYQGLHAEVGVGGLAFAQRFTETASTVMNPGSTESSGVGFFDNLTGSYAAAPDKRFMLYASDNANPRVPVSEVGTFGKGSGLGDLELLAAPAPLQLGDRVWFDTDADGIQDADEPGLHGVKVTMTCGSAAPAGTVTGADGSYLFNDVPASSSCTVAFDASGADTSALPGSPAGLTPTTPTAPGSTDTRTGSDIGPNGSVTVTTGTPGANDHTIDAGYVAATVPPASGDLAIGISLDGAPKCACGPATAVVKVDNLGGQTVTGAKLEVTLPEGVVPAPGSGFTVVDGKIVTTMTGNLPAGATAELPIRLTLPCATPAEPRKITLSAAVSGFTDTEGVPLTDSVAKNDRATTVVELCAKSVDPVYEPDQVYDVVVDFPSDTIVQCKGRWICGGLEVRNNSTGPVKDVRVSVDVPVGLKFWPQHNTGWTFENGKATRVLPGPLQPGEITKLKLVLSVPCDSPAGSTHTLTASAGPFSGPNGASAVDAKPVDNTDSTTVKVSGAMAKRCA